MLLYKVGETSDLGITVVIIVENGENLKKLN